MAYLSAIKRMLAEPAWLNGEILRISTGLTPELLFFIDQHSDFNVLRAGFSGLRFKLRCNADDLRNMLSDKKNSSPQGKKSMLRVLHSLISDLPDFKPNNHFSDSRACYRSPVKSNPRRQLTSISPGVAIGNTLYKEELCKGTFFSPDMTVLCTLYAYGLTVTQAQALMPKIAQLCPGRFRTVSNKMHNIGLVTSSNTKAMTQLKLSYGYALGIMLFTMLDKIMKVAQKDEFGYPHPFSYLAVYTFFTNRICYDLFNYDKAGNRSKDLWTFSAFIKIVLETLNGETILREVRCPKCGRKYLAIQNTNRMYPCPFCRGGKPAETVEEPSPVEHLEGGDNPCL